MTKIAYVLGNKAKQSLSPRIFNFWFKQNKTNGAYKSKQIQIKKFNKEISKILKNKNVCGFNVTIPFKEMIINKLDKIDKHSKKIGAVNFVTKINNKWVGKNTDWIGFLNTIKKSKKTIKNNKAVVFGYGGVSKAIIYALQKNGFKEISVYNRSEKKIKGLSLKKGIKKITLESAIKKMDTFDIAINTTPTNILKKNKKKYNIFAFDAVYKPKETGFLSHFPKNKRMYGIEMLVYQAEPCFKEWFGVRPKTNKRLFDALEIKGP